MLPRLIFAILTTVLQEVAFALIVLLVFPRMGVPVFIPGLGLFMLAWAAGCTLVYRAGSRALKKKPLIGLWSLVGGTARVVTRLSPEGKVRIHDELWAATSSDGAVIKEGEEVVVVSQEGLRLIVRRRETGGQKTSA